MTCPPPSTTSRGPSLQRAAAGFELGQKRLRMELSARPDQGGDGGPTLESILSMAQSFQNTKSGMVDIAAQEKEEDKADITNCQSIYRAVDDLL